MPKSFDYSPASCGTFLLYHRNLFFAYYRKTFSVICEMLLTVTCRHPLSFCTSFAGQNGNHCQCGEAAHSEDMMRNIRQRQRKVQRLRCKAVFCVLKILKPAQSTLVRLQCSVRTMKFPLRKNILPTMRKMQLPAKPRICRKHCLFRALQERQNPFRRF